LTGTKKIFKSTPSVTDTWTVVVGVAHPNTVTSPTGSRFFRVRQQGHPKQSPAGFGLANIIRPKPALSAKTSPGWRWELRQTFLCLVGLGWFTATNVRKEQ
jgi:hypothetical protein